MNVVHRTIERADPDAVAELGRYGVSTIHEAQGRTGYLGPRMRPVYAGARAAGTAVTVSVPPCDNWMIHVAIEHCRPGDVMVVSPTSPSSSGYFGELLACSLAAHGVGAIVLDGGCRDVAEITGMGFPVWSTSISAQGTVKETLGSVNVPIVCCGQIVHPGDVIVGDDDGVVVVRRGDAASIAEASRKREADEADKRRRLQAGELGLDINAMRDRLAAKGLKYV